MQQDEDKRLERIVLRVSKREKGTIEQMAELNKRTVSNYIRKVLGLPEERIGRPPRGSK